jgi:D-alanyl-D-alanine carboxypeptidase
MVAMFTDNTKGISASVYCPGQGVWKGVSGISYAGHPLTTDMEFGIASNSKLFVAVTMLRLAEDNIISLNDPLSRWIPTYTNVKPTITIRQLLNHTSGVSDPFFSTSFLDTIKKHPTHVYTPAEVLALLGPQLFNPGTGYGYSNINYVLAGMVAKSATGENMSKLIRDYILTPLQLDSTFYDVEEPEIGTLAHRWSGNIAVDLHDTSRVSLNTAGGPAGSIFSTAGDMAKWYHALMSNQVLNASSFAELTTFATPGNYGLGLQRSISNFGTTVWGHGGSTIGYQSRVVYDPCMQTTVCGLANADWAAVDGITLMLYKLLIDNLPACAGAVAGTTTVLQGQNSVVYSVPAITNALTYIWTLPPGASGTSTTRTITVNYGATAVSGNISVKGNNIYGDGAESLLAINVIKSDLPLNNLTVSDTEVKCFNAYNTITIAGSSPVLFANGSTVTFIAGQSIQFLPGFYAQQGSFVNASITTGGSYCDPVEPGFFEPVKSEKSTSQTDKLKNEWIDIEKQMKIFPNPNSGRFAVELKNFNFPVRIQVLNMLGETIYQSGLSSSERHVVELGGLQKGFYFVRAYDTKSQFTKKIVVR